MAGSGSVVLYDCLSFERWVGAIACATHPAEEF